MEVEGVLAVQAKGYIVCTVYDVQLRGLAFHTHKPNQRVTSNQLLKIKWLIYKPGWDSIDCGGGGLESVF